MSELLLYTIPFSHFCDLGRWSLQRANVPFTECPRLPGFHSPSVMQARWEASGERASKTPLLVRDSNSIFSYMFGLFGAGKELAGDSSWGIAEFAESHMPDNMRSPGPSAELQKLLDEDLGPSVRAVVYSYLLAPDASGMHGNHPAVALMCEHERIPAFQRTLWSRARNVVAQKMYQGMVRDAENIKKVHDTVDACVAKLDEMLPSLGPATIAPGVPSRVHLAIAALLSPLVMPNHALTAFYGQELLTIDVIPAEMAALVHKYRATNVGKMIMQLYDECRMHGVKSAQ